MPTVEQIWRQVLPPGTDLVAGEAGLYNGVNWVITLRPSAPGFDNVRGSEFALIDTSVARSLGVTLPSLVLFLAERAVSGIGLLGEVLPEAGEQAQSSRIPILQLPPGSNLAALEASIASLASEERHHLYQREQELSQILMELALLGRGIAAIVQKLQELTGRTAWLLGPDLKPLFPLDAGVTLDEIRPSLLGLLAKASSHIAGLKLTEQLAGFVCPVLRGEGTAGYLVVTAPLGELGEADRVAARVGALALAVEMSRRQAVADTEDRFQMEMMESLLSGELSPEAITERAVRLGLDLSLNYAVMAVSLAGSHYQLETIVRQAASFLDNAFCHRRGDTMVVLRPVAAATTVHDLRRMGQDVARELTAHFGGIVSIGIGRLYPGVEGLRKAVPEAEHALVMGSRLFGAGSVSLFADLGIYRLLFSAKPEELRHFYEECLERLVEYDRQHNGELMRTLEALLQYPTLAKTAQTLHIHRNTLLYRLQRIQEVAGLDLEDGDTRLTLHLALRAGDILRVS